MTQQQSIHTHSHQPAPHSHDHQITQGHGVEGDGFMRFLGRVAHNSGASLSNYRSSRLILASNKTMVISLLLLLGGVILAHVLPSALGSVAIAFVVVVAGHLAVIVMGGLIVVLVVRSVRTRIRRTVINSIPWTGREHVLDVGCGTGMLLNGCAQKLTTGKAIGIDLWQQEVAGSTDTLWENAKAEGVAGKVEYQTMDARHLTFENATFEVVVSSLALHHIGSQRADREQAVTQMIRVLKPGGYLSIVDVGSMMNIAEDVMGNAGLEIVYRRKTRFYRVATARKDKNSG